MKDVTSLVMRVEAKGADKSARDLDSVARASRRAQSGNEGLSKSLKTLASAAAFAYTAVASLSKIKDVTVAFQSLENRLITATGSFENSQVALSELRELVEKTPYQLNELTTAFISLVNYGLTPSERALTAYGDTASAMGKELNQMVEAVADAITGEFERLKEFGIKSKVEGDNVIFTFRGVKTEVQNNAAAIEEYLIRLGEKNFAGNMQREMDTLGGAISNLAVEWDELFLNISEAGVGEAMESNIRKATQALDRLNTYISSGALGQSLDNLGNRFDRLFTQNISQGINTATSLFEAGRMEWSGSINEFIDHVLENFGYLPEMTVAAVQLMGVEFAFLVDVASDTGQGIFQAFKEWLASLLAHVGNVMAEIADQINFLDGNTNNFNDNSSLISNTAAKNIAAITSKMQTEWQSAVENRRQGITDVMGELDHNINEVKKGALELDAILFKNGANKVGNYFKNLYEGAVGSKDVLAGFAVNADKTSDAVDGVTDGVKSLGSASSGAASKMSEAAREADRQAQAYERLASSLDPATQKLKDYQEQLALINSQAKTPEERDRMISLLNEKRDDYLMGGEFERYESELEKLNNWHQEKRDLLQMWYEQHQGDAQEHHAKLNEIEALYAQNRQAIMLDGYGAIIGTLTGLTKGWVDEQSDAYRAAAAVEKAFALYTVAVKAGPAMAREWDNPENVTVFQKIAAAAAVGAKFGFFQQLVSSLTPGFEHGGVVPGSSFSGDRVMARVNSGEVIMNRQQQANTLMAVANGGGQGGSRQTKIVNHIDADSVYDSISASKHEDTIINTISANPAKFRNLMGI